MRTTLLLVLVALATLLGCGPKPTGGTPDTPPPKDDIDDTNFGDPPHRSESDARGSVQVFLEAMAVCTEMACGAQNKCCNSCGFRGWVVDGKPARSTTTALPECKVDGCGSCRYKLAAKGDVTDTEFVTASWLKMVIETDLGGPIDGSEWSMADLTATADGTGCTNADQCGSSPVGSALCGGPDHFIVYCKETTHQEKLDTILEVVNKKLAAEAQKQSESGLAGACVVEQPPTIELVDGKCTAKTK